MRAGVAVTDRDWKEIESELNGLVPRLPQGEKRTSPDYGIRKAIWADEQALLAHIADALVQAEHH